MVASRFGRVGHRGRLRGVERGWRGKRAISPWKILIATAIQTGVRPDGRVLAPIMPWRAYAGLTKSDVRAIVEYLSNLPATSHKVPGPFGLDEKPAIFRMTILPPEKASQHD